MEYDPEFESAAATRLPIPVITAHATLGLVGLLLWGAYLLADEERLAWATIADLGLGVLFGLIMAGRWISVYRAAAYPGSSPSTVVTVPPERHFPLPVVVIHGVLAATTIVLVLFTAFFAS